MYCTACAWRFNAGGIETKKQLQQIEKDEKLIHQQKHKQARRPGNPDEVLHIERDYHAAEIGNFYTEVNNNPTITSTTYGDVLTVASSNFTASQNHLVIITAHIHNNTANESTGIRVVRGTTPTVIADSEAVLESASTTNLTLRQNYNWWGIINTNPAEQLKVQIKSTGSGTAAADFITCAVIKLGPDLTSGVDYIAPAVNNTTATFSAFDTDISGATTGSFTPANANNRWLILAKARYGLGLSGLTSVQSRIDRSGTSTNTHPQAQQEGESTDDYIVLVTARVDTLAASAHNYTEISRLVETGGGTGAVNSARQNSGIFALNLDSFKNVSTILQQDNSLGQPNTSSTAYADQVATTSITTNQIGNVMALGYVTMDTALSGTNPFKMRMQINNTDPQDLPNSTTNDYTTKAYDLTTWTNEDLMPVLFCHIENLSAATHNIDIDGSVLTPGASRGTWNRTIVAFSMEMASVALTQVKSETIAINEGIVKVLGKQVVKVVSESVGINENSGKFLGTTSDFITPSNFQLRGSGASNLGGSMSGSVLPSRIFDNVTMAEATGGDPTPDHRCFYIYNSHASLTMQQVKIWFSENTPGGDHVQMGLGNSLTGSATIETAIANENTAPSPAITFVDAPNKDNALVVGDIPAGHHKAIWLRRTVPAGINNPLTNNTYRIMAEFVTNHV